MSNVLYPSFKQALLNKELDLNTDTIKVSLVTTSYSYSSAHDFYDDVSANVVGTPQTIANPTITGGTFDGDNVTFSAVASGSTIGGYVVWADLAGASSADNLIAFFDTDGSGAISVPTNGGDITISFSGSGIFSL